MVELTQAMIDLYNNADFSLLRKQVAAILNNENLLKEERSKPIENPANDMKTQVQQAFKQWAGSETYSWNLIIV